MDALSIFLIGLIAIIAFVVIVVAIVLFIFLRLIWKAFKSDDKPKQYSTHS